MYFLEWRMIIAGSNLLLGGAVCLWPRYHCSWELDLPWWVNVLFGFLPWLDPKHVIAYLFQLVNYMTFFAWWIPTVLLKTEVSDAYCLALNVVLGVFWVLFVVIGQYDNHITERDKPYWRGTYLNSKTDRLNRSLNGGFCLPRGGGWKLLYCFALVIAVSGTLVLVCWYSLPFFGRLFVEFFKELVFGW